MRVFALAHILSLNQVSSLKRRDNNASNIAFQGGKDAIVGEQMANLDG